MVAGSFGDLAIHHHPAVQVTVGVEGPVTVIRADGGRDTCRLVVVTSGAQHSVRSDARSAALSIYLGPATREGIALNALSHARGPHKGVWVVSGGEQLADSAAAPMAAGGQHGQDAAPDARQCCKPDRGQSPPLGASFQSFRHQGRRPGWSR